MDLEALTIYARVAELASFTKAAEQLGVQKARVSISVQSLEAELGTRLLQRTTRSVRATPDGKAFYGRCRALLADLDELGTLFRQAPTALRGRLGVDMPTGMARDLVIPRPGEFIAAHPQIDLELSSTDRRVDLVSEGFDCVVRVGVLHDSGLIARRIGRFRMLNYAAPAYLAAHGTPATLDDHRLIHYARTLGVKSPGWEYFDGTRWRFKPMRGALTVDNVQAYQAACIVGLGLIQVPAMVNPHGLVEVLPVLVAEPMPVSLLYAHRAGSKRLQAWMAWLAGVLEQGLIDCGPVRLRCSPHGAHRCCITAVGQLPERLLIQRRRQVCDRAFADRWSASSKTAGRRHDERAGRPRATRRQRTRHRVAPVAWVDSALRGEGRAPTIPVRYAPCRAPVKDAWAQGETQGRLRAVPQEA